MGGGLDLCTRGDVWADGPRWGGGDRCQGALTVPSRCDLTPYVSPQVKVTLIWPMLSTTPVSARLSPGDAVLRSLWQLCGSSGLAGAGIPNSRQGELWFSPQITSTGRRTSTSCLSCGARSYVLVGLGSPSQGSAHTLEGFPLLKCGSPLLAGHLRLGRPPYTPPVCGHYPWGQRDLLVSWKADCTSPGPGRKVWIKAHSRAGWQERSDLGGLGKKEGV